MNKKLIYFVDPEMGLINIIQELVIEEFVVETYVDGNSVCQAFNVRHPDMIILNIELKGTFGHSLCAQIRKLSQIPIILISDENSDYDIAEALKSDADAYIVKPISSTELIARINTIFRRVEWDKNPIERSEVFKISNIIIDTFARCVKCNNKSISLTNMELSFLTYLVKNKNIAVSRRELINNVWGSTGIFGTRAMDDILKRMRRKLSDGGLGLKIETVRGYGFILRE